MCCILGRCFILDCVYCYCTVQWVGQFLLPRDCSTRFAVCCLFFFFLLFFSSSLSLVVSSMFCFRHLQAMLWYYTTTIAAWKWKENDATATTCARVFLHIFHFVRYCFISFSLQHGCMMENATTERWKKKNVNFGTISEQRHRTCVRSIAYKFANSPSLLDINNCCKAAVATATYAKRKVNERRRSLWPSNVNSIPVWYIFVWSK